MSTFSSTNSRRAINHLHRDGGQPRSRGRAFRTVMLTSAALVSASGAYGQTAAVVAPVDATTAATAGATAGVDEIIVTANRRAENLQKVPITISAFGGETLKTLGVQSVVDLPQITPGLNFQRTLVGTNAFLRGVGTQTAGYSTEVPVATYIDGLYLPNSAASSFSFNNIERIEVLKGPQGTLYGRNTTGGLINVITKEPGSDTHVDASASYGNYSTAQLNFYGSTPISDTLAANFAALYIDQADGWGRNAFLNTEAYKLRDLGFQGKLKWTPEPDTKITLRGFYDRTSTDEGSAGAIFPGTFATDGETYLGEYRYNDRYQVFANQRMYSLSLKAEHTFDFATLTSLTGYINNKAHGLISQNGVAGVPISGQGSINLGGGDSFQRARTFSEELQLASNSKKSPFQWIVGAYFYDDTTLIKSNVFGTCTNGALPCAAPAPTQTNGRQRTRSYAGFVEGTYSITPTTRVTLGVRYTSDEKSLTGTLVPLPGLPNSFPAFPPGTVLQPGQPSAAFPQGFPTDVTFNKVTFKAVAAQDLTANISAYASFNRGFKSGGFNPTSFSNPASRPEVLDAYEIGVKSELFDHLLRLNASAFYYDYQDIQLRTTAPPAPPGSTLLYNAARAHNKGVDVDFLFAPVKGLTFNGGFEYLDARFTYFPGGIATTPRVVGPGVLGGTTTAIRDLSGNRLALAPEFTYSLGATYGFDTAVGRFDLNANDAYKSSFFWEPDNRLRQSPYHLVNASLTWTALNPRYSVQAFVRNLNGVYYALSAGNGGGNDVYLPGAPRTFGAKVRYQF